MDSDRRHELETNDLREFLDNFKDFWDKHGNRLLIALIVVLGSWVAYVQYGKWQTEKAETAYTELNTAGSADAFRDVAGEHGMVHDEAMRRGGDTALSEARQAVIGGDDKAMETALAAANSAYTALVERGKTVEYQLVGQEGLAKVALMRDESDKAATHYQAVIDLAGDVFISQAQRAQNALDRIDLVKRPVAFSPEPAPAVSPEVEDLITPPGLPPLLPTE